MKRREFIHTVGLTVAALAAQGHLPLLAAQQRKRNLPSKNTHVDPCAIEPLTGYLPSFSLAGGAGMGEAFAARYELVYTHGATDVSGIRKNQGSIDVSFKSGRCETEELRKVDCEHIVKTSLHCSGSLHTASQWAMESIVGGRPDLGFTEQGAWDGKTMTVQAQSWTQKRATTHPLIARWALLPLIASGRFKKEPLSFDLLDDSTLRPNQILRYEGKIEVPVKGGIVNLDSYVQTGWGIVPTHYLVDDQARVQLITMSTVNWALKKA